MTWEIVMAEEVTTMEDSWGPAWWRAELRRVVVPDTAGTTTSSQVEREKLTGDKKQGEMITLRLIPYGDLWKVATRDAKTMVAWALYESLKRAGILDEFGNVVDDGAGGMVSGP